MSGGGDIVLKVQLFAKAKELAGGKSSIQISLKQQHASITCGDFLETYVFVAEPALKALQGSAFLAVNDEYAVVEQLLQLKSSDDLALIPPISGG